jgi:hypothetical protein
MEINNKTIFFKSLPEYYDKEYSGKKPNTVRIVSEEEDNLIQISEIDFIMIENTVTGKEFIRLLIDITRFVYNDFIIYIFSFDITRRRLKCKLKNY